MTHRPLTIALYANAALLAGVLLVLVGRNGGPRFPESVAMAQQAPSPIAGGAGFYLMPAQFATNSWGCYVMDVDAQTLVAYVYDPATPRTLRLVAARSFVYDRQLRSYNTLPRPDDIAEIVRNERDQSRRSEEAIDASQNAATRPVVPND